MVWFKVDDNFAFHRKAVAAGNAAVGLWARAGSWCAHQLNDGYVPDYMISSLGNRAQAKRLVLVGLWERVDGGYRFWQWNDPGRQPTREEVEEDRAAARERMRKIRGKRSSPEQPPERTENEQGNRGGTSPPVRQPVPSRPEVLRGSVGKSSPRRNARATSDDDESKIERTIADVIRECTGYNIPADHATQVRHDLLDGRPVDKPVAYVAKSIRERPHDFVPASMRDPASRSVSEAIRAARGES